jgi:outer membrane protein OmpA-like peptidoglycan-associated protein
MWRKLLVIVPVAVLALGASTACATKKFVQTSVSEVNDKVDSLGRSVEATQERTRQNEAKIADVDQRAQSAAQAAGQAASAADATARQAGSAAAAANSNANAVGGKVDTLDKATRRLIFEVVLSEDSGNFTFGRADLPDGAKQKIDELVSKLTQDPKNIYLEIEGHTDSVGGKEINEKVGMGRAESVKRYLYEKHHIPLHKMNVISYGAEKPAAPNTTKEGRAQNRRVVIRILA